jgi:hypothetical protein
MVVEKGEKIHVMIRRKFETDLRRHFIGEITAVSGTLVRVEGHSYLLDTLTNQYIRKQHKRSRIIGLGDSGNIVSVLPSNAVLENVTYTQSEQNCLVVTDGKTFSLDVNEFSTMR